MNNILEASILDVKRGYTYDDETYSCIICGKSYEEGIIYNMDDCLMNAKKAVLMHIKIHHGSMFEYLLNMNKKYTGLTDNQKQLLTLFYNGMDDKEIAKTIEAKSSTIRTQRFSFREKAKQAKIYLAIIELLEERMNNKNEAFVPIHSTATSVDERYAITYKERDSILNAYFKDGKLIEFPKKQKRKIAILQKFASMFDESKEYTELEVNEVIKKVFEDYVTIRRYLIEYGFLDRIPDGSKYWIKK